MRIPRYVEAVEKGAVVPAARPTLVTETATTATVDGQWAFGQITAHHAIQVAIAKARSGQTAAVSVMRCNHIGRLGEYTELAARQGLVAFMVGASFGRGATAPHGGAARVLGTNPLSVAVPAGETGPVVVDFATSATAEGKLSVARSKGQQVAPGILLDKDGNPSTDPDDYYRGGTMLPFGGHKGYGLSVIVDLLGRYLSGAEGWATDQVTFANLIVAIDVEAFRPLQEYRDRVSRRLQEIKAVPPAAGFDEVLIPGEPERHTWAQRMQTGIAIPDDTRELLQALATRLHIPMPTASA
jgi:LDH2 family malate/lactate/ureidoglycolate dehydrogenase